MEHTEIVGLREFLVLFLNKICQLEQCTERTGTRDVSQLHKWLIQQVDILISKKPGTANIIPCS